MAEYVRCSKCSRYDWDNSHKCPPRWLVQVWDHHDFDAGEGVQIYAGDEEDAANLGVEEWDDDRNALGSGFIVRVTHVADGNYLVDGKAWWFTVSAEARIHYGSESCSPPALFTAE